MILAVDVGNSAAKLGLFHNGRLRRLWRVPHGARLPALGRTHGITEIRIASVHPGALAHLLPLLRRLGAPVRRPGRGLRLPTGTACGPGTGQDRRLGAFAAWRRARGPVLVFDAGTALTLNLADAKGRFLGGAIFPGPALALEALAGGTARLPRVSPGPGSPVGRDTRSAIRAGARLAYAGFLKEGLAAARRRLGSRPTVFLTGGGAGLLRGILPGARPVPALVLEGLAALPHGD